MNAHIWTANQILLIRHFPNYRAWIESEAARRQNKYPNWHLDKSMPFYPAYIAHGAWVWECTCGKVWLAEPTFPRAWCPECANEASNGFSRLIFFPSGRGKIERILEMRPRAENRNWEPHETTGILLAENIEHGV